MSSLVKIECELIHQTADAVLIDDGEVEVWLPKSTFNMPDLISHKFVEIPEDLALEKGLI